MTDGIVLLGKMLVKRPNPTSTSVPKKFAILMSSYLVPMKTFLQTHPPTTKAINFFHTLFAQHVSSLNLVLFRCFFITEHI
jgi:hypothetical protein